MKQATLIVFLLGFFAASPAYAGGWTQAPGASYSKVWGTGIFGSSAFDLQGEELDTDDYRILKLSVYGEYGLAEDLTLVGFAEPLGSATHGDRSVAFTGTFLGGLRQRFTSDAAQFAVEVRAGGQPGWGERNLAPTAEDYVFVPAVRTGQLEWELQLGFGLPFGWLSFAAGPRWYTSGDLSHEMIGFAQIGFGPFAGFVIDLHSSLNFPLELLEVVNVTGVGNTRYVGAGIGISYWANDNVSVHVGADGGPLAASNAYAPSLQFGVEFKTR